MAQSFNVTYEIVTPESAEHGEPEESGFEAKAVSLGEAVSACRAGAGLFEDSGRWFTVDGEEDYQTGARTSYALHPPRTITAASYARLARVLCGERRSLAGAWARAEVR